MRLPGYSSFWVVALCSKFTVAYPPSCSDVFGKPRALHCAALLGISLREAVVDEASSFYGIAGLDRPAGVSVSQYWNRVSIPKFWSSGGF